MPIYNAPLADMRFILNEVFNAEQFWQANENLAHVDAATAEAILEEMSEDDKNSCEAALNDDATAFVAKEIPKKIKELKKPIVSIKTSIDIFIFPNSFWNF